MNDDIFRPDGGEWVDQPRPVPEPAVAQPTFGETTINEAGTAGFAVDGTDAFAIERPADGAEVPVDTDGASGARNRLAVTVGAVVGGLLLVVVVGSSTGPRPVVGEAGSLRTEEVDVDPTVATSPTTDDDDDDLPTIRRGDGATTSRVDPRGDTLVVATVTEDTTFDDEFFDDDDFDDDDFFDDDFFDDDFFDDDDFDDDPPVRRRIPVVPGRPRVVVPPRTTTTTTIPETTTTIAETTTTESTTTTTTTTTATTAPPVLPPEPAVCAADLEVWTRAGGVLASAPGSGLFFSTDRAGTWAAIGADTEGTAVHRVLVPDPAGPGYWIGGAGGVFRTNDGSVFGPVGAAGDVRSLAVEVVANGPDLMLAGVGDPTTLRRSADDGVNWTDVATLPAGVGAIGHPLLVDTGVALLGTGSGVYRSIDGGQAWTPTAVHSAPVVGAPLVAMVGGAETIFWLQADGSVAQSIDGGVRWTVAVPAGSTPPTVTDVVRLPDGRLLSANGTNLLVSAAAGAPWTAAGPALPFAPAGVAHSAADGGVYIWKSACGPDAVVRVDAPSS